MERGEYIPGYDEEVEKTEVAKTEAELKRKGVLRKIIASKLRYWIAAGVISMGVEGVLEMAHKDRLELKDPKKAEQLLKEYSRPGEVAPLADETEFTEKEFSPRITILLSEANDRANDAESISDFTIVGAKEAGFDPEVLKQIWSKGYPKGLVEGNLSKVNLHVSEGNLKLYGKEGYFAGSVKRFTGCIDFYTGNKPDRNVYQTLDWHFSHEIAHITDWNNNIKLLPIERERFLYEVSKRYNSADAFKDVFVNMYLNDIKDSDPQIQKYYRVSEWWGMVAETYFTFPQQLKEMSPKDFDLAQKWLAKDDPNFDPVEAKQFREMVIQFGGK